MKSSAQLWVIVLVFVLLPGIAHPQSQRDQLAQMVAQLQAAPRNDALRIEIIKLALTLVPPPAVPEDAERFEGRGQFAFGHAKSPADYLDAANEYERAIAAAPWVAGYYSDLCTIYEKAERYAEARRNCEFYLASGPSAQDASEMRKRIAGLEFAIEKANSPEAMAERQRQKEADERRAAEEMIRGLDGVVFYRALTGMEGPRLLAFRRQNFCRIRGGRVEQVERQTGDLPLFFICGDTSPDDPQPIGTETVCERSAPFVGRFANMTCPGCEDYKWELAEDGRTLIYHLPPGWTGPDTKYERQ